MESTIEQHGGAVLIHLRGSIDASTAPTAIELLEQQVHSGNNQIVLNVSEVDFMSSAGIRCLLNTVKLARQAGGDLRLAAVAPVIQKVLDMGGITNIIQIYQDNTTALDSFVS